MSWMKNRTDGMMPGAEVEPAADPVGVDPVVEQALADFRLSVHAWSEAAYSRPRMPMQAAHSGWRMAATWALGCVLVAGGLSGAALEHHHREVLARLRAEQQAQQQKLAAQQRNAHVSDEDLLATVDSDISRDVPAAMQPLENLMDENAGQ
jgi:hypothetical protein